MPRAANFESCKMIDVYKYSHLPISPFPPSHQGQYVLTYEVLPEVEKRSTGGRSPSLGQILKPWDLVICVGKVIQRDGRHLQEQLILGDPLDRLN